jgi:hypothetical protein
MSDVNYADLLGRPFHETDWTCWQLVREVYRRLGIDLPAYPYGSDLRERAALAESVRGQFVRLDGPQPWAIVAIQAIASRGGIIHTGVCLPDLAHVLHVREQCGTILTPLSILRRGHCVEGFYGWNQCASS